MCKNLNIVIQIVKFPATCPLSAWTSVTIPAESNLALRVVSAPSPSFPPRTTTRTGGPRRTSVATRTFCRENRTTQRAVRRLERRSPRKNESEKRSIPETEAEGVLE